jgi:hypothetical protein
MKALEVKMKLIIVWGRIKDESSGLEFYHEKSFTESQRKEF